MTVKNALFVLFLVSSVFAHLGSGEDITIDGYLIDFGYAPEIPNTNENTILAFDIVNDSTHEIIEPTSVWIKISDSEKIIFAGTFHPEHEQISLSYLFPKPDQYEITVRFEKNGENLIQADFKLEIMGEEQNTWIFLISGAVLFAAGIILGKYYGALPPKSLENE